MERIKYYIKVIKWMWEHREEPPNRAKWRRMLREINVSPDAHR